MATPFGFRRFLIALGSLAIALVVPAAAVAQETEPPAEESPAPDEQGQDAVAGDVECVATGYLADSEDEVSRLQRELSEQSVHRVDGVPLRSGETWVIPDGSQPVVVLDSTGPVSGGDESVSLGGQEFAAASETYDGARERFVSNATMTYLGSTVRSLGFRVDSGQCEVAVALSVDRSAWSTLLGGVAIAVTAVFGLLMVLVARLRKGGWVRRLGFAAPLGLVAGAGQGVVLLEAGVADPFAEFPWWAPGVGLGLAALLPLTRWRRRAAPGAGLPAAPWPPPQAPLAGYQMEALVARTEVAGIFRATRARPDARPSSADQPAPGDSVAERALVKVAFAKRFGEPLTRLRLEREASVLSGWEHPNLLRLRDVVPAESGPPTLIFEHVNGMPLRQLYEGGGSLSSAQVVTVLLEVLAGLQALHVRDLVHRDVRPEHVWLTADGRVLLGGFELTCVGVEHAVAPEAVEPYASPEQQAGQVLDARSDLYACGVMLRELLPEPLPSPVQALLSEVMADDPAARPGSAEQFAAGLRAAGEQAFGPDWVGRGALAGAVASQLAVGAAVTGYLLAGGAGTTGGTGLGAAAGAAGAGAAAAGLGAAADSAGLAASDAGSLGAAGVASGGGSTTAGVTATAPAAPAGGGGSAGGGLGTAVNAAAAAVAGVAIVVGAVLANPNPAEARSEVITPAQARVIFIRTVDEGRGNEFAHFVEASQGSFESLLDEADSVAESPLTEVEVGVSPDQFEYPAWFVASALIPFGDGTASVFARFDREQRDEPWLMTSFLWSTDRVLPAALIDGEGWLAPPPTTVEPLVDQSELPQRYGEWVSEQMAAYVAAEFEGVALDGVVEYEEFEWLPARDSYLLLMGDPARYWPRVVDYGELEGNRTKAVGRRDWLQREGDRDPDTEEVSPVTYEDLSTIHLADGAVLVSFTVAAFETTMGYGHDGSTGPCGEYPSFRHQGTEYRAFAVDRLVRVQAWVPLVETVPEGNDTDPILLTDPIISTTTPSDRSEPC